MTTSKGKNVPKVIPVPKGKSQRQGEMPAVLAEIPSDLQILTVYTVSVRLCCCRRSTTVCVEAVYLHSVVVK